ncbi:MAG: 50S ribosomal protein L29 [Candidatus Aminicenantaceae bacterium]
MKAQEIRELSLEELDNKEDELKDQLFKLKFQKSLGQLENNSRLKLIKKDIARIKTIRKESARGAENEG